MLSAGTGRPAARFVCRLGDDAYLPWLQAELSKAGVDTSASRVVANMSTGAGIVWLDADGAATSVVLGGANTQGWSLLPSLAQASPSQPQPQTAATTAVVNAKEATLLEQHAAEVVAGSDSATGATRSIDGDGSSGSSGATASRKASMLLLQREVPEHVNEAFAAAAAAAGIPVLLDAGGENRPVSPRLLSLVDFLAPNEQELQRLTAGMPTATERQVAAAAGALLAGGVCNVLVTLEGRGSLLLLGQAEEQEEEDKQERGAEGGRGRRCRPVRAIRQPALPVPGGVVVDATAAGDAFRAALAVALVEDRGRHVGQGTYAQEGGGGARPAYEEALRFAAAAGAIAVSRMGAMPSLPTRHEVEQLLVEHGTSPAAQAWDAPELLAAAAEAAATAAAASASATASDASPGDPASAPEPSGTATVVVVSGNTGGGGGGDGDSGSDGGSDGNSGGVSDGGSGARGGAAGAGACPNPDVPAAPGGTGNNSDTTNTAAGKAADDDDACHLLFGARLNSMKARRDLLAAPHHASASDGDGVEQPLAARLRDNGPLGWVARQGLVADGRRGGGRRGLGVVYFNYPEHLEGLTLQQVLGALSAAGLRAGGVAMRFPAEPFRAGALTNPNATLREAAVALAAEGCGWAAQLAAAAAAGSGDGSGGRGGGGTGGPGGHLVVWSAYDGYDYHLQADYAAARSAALDAYRRLADACAELGVAVSLEPKPTDPSSRFSFLPNTAAALAFAEAVGRPNLGLTLDTGHMLMAGECLAQSVAEAAAAGRLFGLHLNDGHGRLGAEDGLAFGAVHGAAAAELVYYLRYKLPARPAGSFSAGAHGLPHAFFDTFPLNEDPVAEAAANVDSFVALWARAARLRRAGLEACLARHDALCSLRLLAAVP